jgi:adenine modification enzyme
MGKLKKQPIKDWFGYVIGFECPKKEIKILVCEKPQADAIISKHHYSGKPTKNSFLSLIVYYKGEVNGALQLGYGIRPKIKGEYNPDEIREFDRMWLSDEMPKFSETITLSLLHFFLKSAYPKIKYLVSYSDTSVGNFGTIYKAANYKLIDDIKADFYILESGERVHPVSMWHRHKSRAWSLMQELYPGIRKAEGRQLKFMYELSK